MHAGELLGRRYQLDQRVDAGGMGTVWRGIDTRLHRTVAIKVLHAGLANDQVFRKRFEVEARAVAALQAPGIVNIYDYGEDTGPDGTLCYLIMEFVEGRSLAAILAQHGRIEPRELMKILAETGDALDAAHRSGIIHRDIKPGNILITRREGKPKIVDFGIARAHGEAGLTSTGMIMGTAAYASPEQLNGHRLTGASDVYSLGVVAYECLAGRKPFNGDTPAAIIAGHIGHRPPALPPDTPPAMAGLVMRTLAKDPGDRWPSAAAFAQACRDAANGRGPAPTTAVTTPQAAPTSVMSAAPTDVMSAAPASPPRGVARPTARPSQPAPPTHPVPEPEEPEKNRLGIIAVVTGLVVLAMVAILVLQRWLPGDETSADDGSTEEVTAETGTPPDTTEDTEEPEDEPEDDITTDAEPPPETDDPIQTGLVPDVTGQAPADARNNLAATGFSTVTELMSGNGTYECEIIGQNPPGGAEHPVDREVTITILLTESEEACATRP